MSNDLEPKRGFGLWNNRLWILSAGLGAATIVSGMTIIHDTSRQRAALHAVVRSTARQVVSLAGSRVEILALKTFAPVMPWSAAVSPTNESAFAALVRVQQSATRCRCRDTLAATEFFRYDVGRRAMTRLTAAGVSPSSADSLAPVLERTALNEANRARLQPGVRTHLIVGRELGDHAALAVVQSDSAGTAMVVYGALVPAKDFALRLLRDAAVRTSLGDSASPASLRDIQFSAIAPDSTTIVETMDAAHSFRATIHPKGPLDGLAITAALDADQVPVRINIGREERLHLGVLLLATILVIGFAVGSSRRELLLARARSDFIAGVSHDLRMPLAQILIAGETLTLERERDVSDRRVLSHAIVREARRLVSIVDNVLLFSRSGTRRPKPMVRPVPVDDLFNDVVEAVGLAVDDAGQSIAVRASASLAVSGDRQLLRQALVNLVDNALKYGVRGQQIQLGAERSANVVRLSVDDHGPGVPVEERTRVFEPYERLFRDRTSERTGSGLGLAVVREIASLLNGRAWLEDAPGGGTRAVIELPIAERAAESTPSHAMS